MLLIAGPRSSFCYSFCKKEFQIRGSFEYLRDFEGGTFKLEFFLSLVTAEIELQSTADN